jgi:hypothetical protein
MKYDHKNRRWWILPLGISIALFAFAVQVWLAVVIVKAVW